MWFGSSISSLPVKFGKQSCSNQSQFVSLRRLNKTCIKGFTLHIPTRNIQGDTKKTVITKNRIISKILFRLTQNFSYIRSSLCSRHLQSFKSVLQKLFVSLAHKKCAPNELPGCRHIWIRWAFICGDTLRTGCMETTPRLSLT